MTTFNLTCEAVEATLPDYLDETLEEWVRDSIDEHLGECVRCSALARELRNMEREAATLPALLPERDLWPEVAHGIGAPVITLESVPESEPLESNEPPALAEAAVITLEPVPESEPLAQSNEPPALAEAPLQTSEPSLTTSEPSLPTIEPSLPTIEPSLLTNEASLPTSEAMEPAREPLLPATEVPVSATALPIPLPQRRKKRWGPQSMGLAAAALVLVTAGSTFLLTVRWLGPARTPHVVADTVTRQLSSRTNVPADRAVLAPSVRSQQLGLDSSAPIPSGPLGSSLTVATTSAPQVRRSSDEGVYDKEINMLQTMTRRRKAELEPSTAAVIAKNLRIIDSNIAQIRAALQKDPGNSLLDDQVSRALDMKVELLRRVAMLRSNT